MSNLINLALEEVRELSFFYRDTLQGPSAEEQPINFTVTNQFDIQPSENRVLIRVEITLELDEAKPGSQVLHHETLFVFSVKGVDFTPQTDPETNEAVVILPIQISATLVGAAYSTCRGILFTRAAGTQWGMHLLPMTSPLKLVEGMGEKFRRSQPKGQESATDTFVMTASQSEKPNEKAPQAKKTSPPSAKKQLQAQVDNGNNPPTAR
jgi:hypothetical protein